MKTYRQRNITFVFQFLSIDLMNKQTGNMYKVRLFMSIYTDRFVLKIKKEGINI